MTDTGPEPFSSIVESNAAAGFHMIELAESDEAALHDDWGNDHGRVRIQPGRVGLVSVAGNHFPEVRVNSYTAEPVPPASSPRIALEILGTWTVTFRTRQVQVWSGDSYPGDQLPVELPTSAGGRYLLRVAVGHRDIGAVDPEEWVDAYYAEHDEAPRGFERFVIDIWPTDG